MGEDWTVYFRSRTYLFSLQKLPSLKTSLVSLAKEWLGLLGSFRALKIGFLSLDEGMEELTKQTVNGKGQGSVELSECFCKRQKHQPHLSASYTSFLLIGSQ